MGAAPPWLAEAPPATGRSTPAPLRHHHNLEHRPRRDPQRPVERGQLAIDHVEGRSRRDHLDYPHGVEVNGGVGAAERDEAGAERAGPGVHGANRAPAPLRGANRGPEGVYHFESSSQGMSQPGRMPM